MRFEGPRLGGDRQKGLTIFLTLSLSSFSSRIMRAMSRCTADANTTSSVPALEAMLQTISSWEKTL